MSPMHVEFAASRPSGDYALVLPAAGTNRPAAANLGDAASVDAMLKRQRFEGDAGSAAEVFVAADGGVRRVLFVGVGGGSTPSEIAEKLGGTAVAKLLTSGERHLVFDLSGLSFDADATARVALAA